MVARLEWVLLAYRLPREPSTPRITVWRKLRRLGVVQLVDGLVALPADARTVEQLDWLADEVLEAGGEAWTWLGRLGSASQERALPTRMAEAVAEEYQALIADAEASASEAERCAGGWWPVAAGAAPDRPRDFFPPARARAWPAPRSTGWRSRWRPR